MAYIRSVTLATESIDKTIDLFHNMLGMTYERHENKVQFGDGQISPGTRIQFVETHEPISPTFQHFEMIGLRTPSDEGIKEYMSLLQHHSQSFHGPFTLNGHPYILFSDDHSQHFSIVSNEHNTGVGLGIPNEMSTVNPIHQVQGLGPIILKTNEPMITTSLLTNIFGLRIKAEYVSPESSKRVIVLECENGGLGSEIHISEPASPVQLPSYGIVEQLELTAQNDSEYRYALQQLNQHGIPYQRLKNESAQTQSLRVNDISGISFILTWTDTMKGS
ncbi:lactoylglutathione lyase [Staphylococcus lutrae]|uniref:Lactoylglutathione lyase n=1 Tax=Staphylococcus lutrae TaxID=155085 RepID=A0AAC9RVR1_9STAP|nr:lactoylglutathione lyase [Staphylococcus lutrae]ARJ51837.1 lactoylglutathione lyase [Staphylococcus lutrae]PNZ36078.1 lactoylglutathione lyase [Staphylococcus lutrae]